MAERQGDRFRAALNGPDGGLVAARFLARVNDSGDCWLWTGAKSGGGYGIFVANGTNVGAHVAAYELWIGPIPEGQQIDHLCRTRLCVNPMHLETVDSLTNTLRGESVMARAIRTGFCKRGHPRTPENLYTARTTGDSQCRQCRVVVKRASYRRNAERERARGRARWAINGPARNEQRRAERAALLRTRREAAGL